MKQTITRTIRGFAVAIVIILALGGLFHLYTGTLPEQRQEEVLIKAIPFVAIFVSIILVFICLIAVGAIALNGRVPLRTYRPIESVIIGGILLGILGLFQGWKLFAYENGFLLLLFAVLLFIFWSHIAPMPPARSRQQPPFVRQAQIAGLVAGIVVWAMCAVYFSTMMKPEAPYGNAQRIWDMMMDEEERQATAERFDEEYKINRIPVAVLISLLPGSIVFLAVRELVDVRMNPNRIPPPTRPVAGPTGDELPIPVTDITGSNV